MAKLPCDICRGKCCYLAPFTKREFKTVRKKYGIPKDAQVVRNTVNGAFFVVTGDEGQCAYLKDGRCSVFADRPLVCRIYGEKPELPCQYLYPEEARKRVADLDAMEDAWKNRRAYGEARDHSVRV